MTAGMTPKQADLWRGTAAVCQGRVGQQSIWAVLYREGDRLFGDELFADLFAGVGWRWTTPVSATPCWWTCAPGWPPPPGRSGYLRSPLLRPGRRGWSGCGGWATPPRGAPRLSTPQPATPPGPACDAR